MKPNTPNWVFLPFSAALTVALALAVSAHAEEVNFEKKSPDAQKREQEASTDSTPLDRKLWSGSFDRASDASAEAAKRLDNLDYGDCERYLEIKPDLPNGDQESYWACMHHSQIAPHLAAQAKSIQKQQRVMSLISKASDVAAVGAVGATIYGELGRKKNGQSDTYDSAANIEKKAGMVSYATGAADFSMGAYAYVAQKNRLEHMKQELSASGVSSRAESNANAALLNAVEAAKKAAYSHMLWGAGKVAAGYGMMYLAKKSQQQAENLESLDEQKFLQQMALQQRAAAGQLPGATAPTPTPVGSGVVPYYQNNNPVITIPNSGTSTTGLAPLPKSVSYNVAGGGSASGSGSSAPLNPNAARNLASALSAGKADAPAASAGGGTGGGSGASAEGEEASKEKNEKAAKEALGSTFEGQLTGGGGLHPFSGGAGGGGAKDEVPNLAALMGGGDGTKLAGTGLSPTQIFQAAQEGTDGTEQGSMVGVSGKSETSLFDITKAKLTKMFQVGNVGAPKNVEVKN